MGKNQKLVVLCFSHGKHVQDQQLSLCSAVKMPLNQFVYILSLLFLLRDFDANLYFRQALLLAPHPPENL